MDDFIKFVGALLGIAVILLGGWWVVTYSYERYSGTPIYVDAPKSAPAPTLAPGATIVRTVVTPTGSPAHRPAAIAPPSGCAIPIASGDGRYGVGGKWYRMSVPPQSPNDLLCVISGSPTWKKGNR